MNRTLQGAATKLLEDLEGASELYHKSPEDRRQGILDSLVAVINFLDRASRRYSDIEREEAVDQMKDAFLALSTALHELRNGTVDDILKPTKFGNAPPISHNVRVKRTVAAAAMEILIVGGGMKRKEAAQFVATRMEKTGIFRESKDPAVAVENWRDQLRTVKERPLLEDIDLDRHDRLDVAHYDRLIGDAARMRQDGRSDQDAQRMFAECIMGGIGLSASYW